VLDEDVQAVALHRGRTRERADPENGFFGVPAGSA
jgi:hypothetical protein